MEGTSSPEFIKEFSKKEFLEERKQTATEIRAKRSEHFAKKQVQETTNTQIGEKEHTLQEQLAPINKLRDDIEIISDTTLGKLRNFFHLRKMRADLLKKQQVYQLSQQEQALLTTESSNISTQLEGSPDLQEAKQMLQSFYEGQKEKWVGSKYTKEDIQRYFSEDYLSKLSLADYILLLRRFPSEMVAHVTRQGIRDHIGFLYHMKGAGEYMDGFMQIIADGRLRSPLGIYLTEGAKEAKIAEFFRNRGCKTREEVSSMLRSFLDRSQGSPGSYTDTMAIHLATQEVADHLYGSETGNEIFLAFPAALIASQYYFSGQLAEDPTRKYEIPFGEHNDIWVWANEERGININAGLVFIPEDARVDPNTGSKYELDENKNPILFRKHNGKPIFKEATTTITSKDFWEKYFTEHPDKRPTKVIYYRGGNPTASLNLCLEQAGIQKKSEGGKEAMYLGFPEHARNANSKPAKEGITRFRSIAQQVCKEYFPPEDEYNKVAVLAAS